MKGTTIDGLALPSGANGVPPGKDAPAFKLPVRRSLRMHPVLAASVAALVLAAMLGFALTRKPVYRAESLVYVEPIVTKVLGDPGGGIYDQARYETFLQQQEQTAERPDLLLKAVQRMGPGVWQRPGETAEAAALRLGTTLKVERVGTSYQLSISVGAPTPQAAAAGANAVTQVYLEQGSKDLKELSAGRVQLLTEERARIDEQMTQLRAEQTQLGASLGMANPVAGGGDAYDAQLQGVRSELSTARAQHDMAAAQLSALTGPGGARSAGAVALAQDAVANDAGVSGMKITINQRRAVLVGQMTGLTPANPQYQEDQKELGRLDAELAGMTARMQTEIEQRNEAKLRGDLQRTGDVEARLNAQLNQETARATNAGPKLQRAAEVAADLERLQTRYATVDDSLRGLELETSGPGMAHLAVAATPPATPEPSKARIVLILALPMAIILGIFAAVFARRLDPRVYTAMDVEEVLGFAPVGLLPARDEVAGHVTEEYLLRLAAALEGAYRGAAARSFVFTAASGSTEVREDVRALRAKLEQLGFGAVVIAAEDVLRAVGETPQGVEGSGHEGFASARLERMKREFDLVLIDAHPLLHSAEAEYAVRSSDGVILVAQSGVTTARELERCAALLRRLSARGVGVMLQGMTLRSGDGEFRSSVAVLERRELAGDSRPARVDLQEPLQPEAAVEPVAPVRAAAVREAAPAVAPVEPAAAPVFEDAGRAAAEAAAARAERAEQVRERVRLRSQAAPVARTPELKMANAVSAEPVRPVERVESMAEQVAVSDEVRVPPAMPTVPAAVVEAREQPRRIPLSERVEAKQDTPKVNLFDRLLSRFQKPAVTSILPDTADDDLDTLEPIALRSGRRLVNGQSAPEPAVVASTAHEEIPMIQPVVESPAPAPTPQPLVSDPAALISPARVWEAKPVAAQVAAPVEVLPAPVAQPIAEAAPAPGLDMVSVEMADAGSTSTGVRRWGPVPERRRLEPAVSPMGTGPLADGLQGEFKREPAVVAMPVSVPTPVSVPERLEPLEAVAPTEAASLPAPVAPAVSAPFLPEPAAIVPVAEAVAWPPVVSRVIAARPTVPVAAPPAAPVTPAPARQAVAALEAAAEAVAPPVQRPAASTAKPALRGWQVKDEEMSPVAPVSRANTQSQASRPASPPLVPTAPPVVEERRPRQWAMLSRFEPRPVRPVADRFRDDETPVAAPRAWDSRDSQRS